ncbi:hypothetical protein ED733_008111 [Metarhizium rileyi]|uniref:Uncharacterized protein n=1 Tax=Metarhizium rileyi (strain RCEF 4871) TaxID=1649241 RepID=A0A5C6GLI4_METRR|nr:hypothetical protein ED733_008111 [Metarhizium rileyi]
MRFVSLLAFASAVLAKCRDPTYYPAIAYRADDCEEPSQKVPKYEECTKLDFGGHLNSLKIGERTESCKLYQNHNCLGNARAVNHTMDVITDPEIIATYSLKCFKSASQK